MCIYIIEMCSKMFKALEIHNLISNISVTCQWKINFIFDGHQAYPYSNVTG